MRLILAIVPIVIATLLPIRACAANSWGVDMSDLWWNPNESGWGANIAHQGDIIFMTLFVYGADSKTRWYVASSMASQGGANAYRFTGTLFETTGPFLGGSFNPANVNARPVGSATLDFPFIEEATLTYSVDGVGVTRAIERQTFRANDLAGAYTGSAIGTLGGCGAGSGSFRDAAELVVSHTGSNVSIAATFGTFGCTYSGAYTQSGRMGSIVGTFTCTSGGGGPFEAREIESGHVSLSMQYFADYGNGCLESGRLGGMRRN